MPIYTAEIYKISKIFKVMQNVKSKTGIKTSIYTAKTFNRASKSLLDPPSKINLGRGSPSQPNPAGLGGHLPIYTAEIHK
ncbi:hypothetical protein, partial [Klebsiella pneumoniae]|uniref:hypothetical protein n=1 Tax=Klebsiella pneumoniae TaxID=573 RepID=UPI003EB6F1CE